MTEQRWTLELIIVTTLAAFSAQTSAAENTGPRQYGVRQCRLGLLHRHIRGSGGCFDGLFVQLDSVGLTQRPERQKYLCGTDGGFHLWQRLNVYINSCFAARPTYPTIWYFNIYN
jgi:hypothetical protein